MEISKFLLVDIILLSIILLLSFLYSQNANQASINLESPELTYDLEKKALFKPTLDQLLELEKKAKIEGSKIDFNSLLGLWKFNSVWQPGSKKEDYIFSQLLRLFSASLELKYLESNNESQIFSLSNSIQFGLLVIQFVGLGNLKGNQPLLPFYFEFLEFKVGEKTLLKKYIALPPEKDRPFFALIGIGKNMEWLAARGRGGGLALWLKDIK